jgi:outer membrane receptor protein involved in Fe transport
MTRLHFAGRHALGLLIALGLPAASAAQTGSAAPFIDPSDERLPAVTVTGTREPQPLAETPAAVGVIGPRAVRQAAPTHPQQLLGQVPGVAIAVTNGEGHSSAIRQPFTTAPLYLFLEDGLPIRATGFFNHNALYELNLPMAGTVEVVRGPGTALYGSDAIGGIVNLLTRAPGERAGAALHAEAGSFGWQRLMLEGDSGAGRLGALRADLNLTRTDGWRERTGYERQSGNLRWDGSTASGARLRTVLSFSRIDQQTGANAPLVLADYRDNPTRNNFPIAFRTVDALRLSSTLEQPLAGGQLSLTPYLRDNGMDLLASFALSSDPTLSQSANRSYGLAARWRRDVEGAWRARLIGGLDLEHSPGSRVEDRLTVTATGSGASRIYTDYRISTRVFDYAVSYQAVSPYLHIEFSPMPQVRVSAGLRHDRLSYRNDNHLGPAPVKDAASANWYGQVGNTAVSYERLSPKLGATWAIAPQASAWASYTTGFRAPSESQLFRPAVASSATDAANRARLSLALKPIQAEQFELGLRGRIGSLEGSLALYDLIKRDDLVSQRDLATNLSVPVNAGKTRHQGVELGLAGRVTPTLRVDGAFSVARHRYVDWVTATADFSGKEMEAAPRTIASARLSWTPRPGALAQLEWVHLGGWWLEASNSSAYPRYPGHNLANARLAWPIGQDISIFLRVINLGDRRFADSAQVSSNTPVYSPGLPRTAYAGAEIRW